MRDSALKLVWAVVIRPNDIVGNELMRDSALKLQDFDGGDGADVVVGNELMRDSALKLDDDGEGGQPLLRWK